MSDGRQGFCLLVSLIPRQLTPVTNSMSISRNGKLAGPKVKVIYGRKNQRKMQNHRKRNAGRVNSHVVGWRRDSQTIAYSRRLTAAHSCNEQTDLLACRKEGASSFLRRLPTGLGCMLKRNQSQRLHQHNGQRWRLINKGGRERELQ